MKHPVLALAILIVLVAMGSSDEKKKPASTTAERAEPRAVVVNAPPAPRIGKPGNPPAFTDANFFGDDKSAPEAFVKSTASKHPLSEPGVIADYPVDMSKSYADVAGHITECDGLAGIALRNCSNLRVNQLAELEAWLYNRALFLHSSRSAFSADEKAWAARTQSACTEDMCPSLERAYLARIAKLESDQFTLANIAQRKLFDDRHFFGAYNAAMPLTVGLALVVVVQFVVLVLVVADSRAKLAQLRRQAGPAGPSGAGPQATGPQVNPGPPPGPSPSSGPSPAGAGGSGAGSTRPGAAGGGDKNPWDILGVKPSDARKTVVAAYRSLMSLYHPDRLPAHCDAAQRAAAEDLCKEINAAFADIRLAKGWN